MRKSSKLGVRSSECEVVSLKLEVRSLELRVKSAGGRFILPLADRRLPGYGAVRSCVKVLPEFRH